MTREERLDEVTRAIVAAARRGGDKDAWLRMAEAALDAADATREPLPWPGPLPMTGECERAGCACHGEKGRQNEEAASGTRTGGTTK